MKTKIKAQEVKNQNTRCAKCKHSFIMIKYENVNTK